MTPRRQKVYDWYDKNWQGLIEKGMTEEILQDLFREKTNLGSLKHELSRTLYRSISSFRSSWKKSYHEVTSMVFEVGLYYYAILRSPNLPAPQPLAGTPAYRQNGRPELKNTKETLKLGERLLSSKFNTLRSDLSKKFAIGKSVLASQILDAIEKAKTPLTKQIKKKADEVEDGQKKYDELTVKYRALQQKSHDLKLKTQEALNGKVEKYKEEIRKLNEARNAASQKIEDLQEKSRELLQQKVSVLDNEIRTCNDERVDVSLVVTKGDEERQELQKQHERETRAKFKEAEASLELESQRLLRDLDLQREQEINTMWSEHLPKTIQEALGRVPEIGMITGELPKQIRALIATTDS